MDVPPPEVDENLVIGRRALQVLELYAGVGVVSRRSLRQQDRDQVFDDDDDSLRSDDSAHGSIPPLIHGYLSDSSEDEEDDIILDADDVVDWQQHVEQAVDDDDGDDSLRSDNSTDDSMPSLERVIFPPPLFVIEGYFRRDEPDEVDNTKDDNSNEFAPFSLLHEDLQTYILSFVATVPFEDPTSTTQSSVTQVLPYVSKRFLELARSNGLWKPAMERLLMKDPDLWIKGLKKLQSSLKEEEDPSAMLHKVHQALSEPGLYEMFRMVVEQHVKVEGPILLFPSSRVQIETPFVTNFFEPNIRILFQNITEGFPQEEGNVVLNGQGNPPTLLLYADRSRRAFLSEIRRCTFHDDRVHVILEPVAHVRICRLSEDDEQQGSIYHARCCRLTAPEIQELRFGPRIVSITTSFENASQRASTLAAMLLPPTSFTVRG